MAPEIPSVLIVNQPRYFHEPVIVALAPSLKITHSAIDLLRNVTLGGIPHYGQKLLAAYAIEQGFPVEKAGLYDKNLIERASQAALVLISAMDIGLDRTTEILRGLPRVNNVVLGGYGCSAAADDFLDQFPGVSVVVGEGEGMMRSVFQDFNSQGEMQPVYQRPDSFDLRLADAEPFMDLSISNKLRGFFGHTGIKPIELSRGCRENCDFCSTAKHSVNFKPLETVIREIEMMSLKQWDVLFFIDQNLMVCPPNYLQEVFEYVNRRGNYWIGEGTITYLKDQAGDWNDKLIRTMAKNCIGFLIGIEDLSHPIRGSATKTRIATNNGLDQLVKDLRELKLPVIYSMIFGSDAQEVGYAEQAAAKVLDLNLTVAAHIATPRRGTPFWNRVVSEGRLEDTRSGKRDMRFHAVHRPEKMSRTDLLTEFMMFQDIVYSYPMIMRRFIRNLNDCGLRYALSLLLTDKIYHASTKAFRWIHPEVARESARKRSTRTFSVGRPSFE